MKETCRICGNDLYNEHFIVQEKMFGSEESFEYIKCSKCGCMQLVDEDMNMSKYYQNNYYSFNQQYTHNSLADFIGSEFFKYRLGKFSLFGPIINCLFASRLQHWIVSPYFDFNKTILDVGCGSGRLLQLMRHRGFKHLKGIDPYNPQVLNYGDVVIENHSIYDEHDKYDTVMLHYSFEHMPNPYKVMSQLNQLLAEDGTLLIRIPLIDSYAWRKYGTNWVQMDAPRHIYLHTLYSFLFLCEKCGLKCDKIIYDSTEYQFVYSEKYLRGYTFNDSYDVFNKSELNYFNKFALWLNKHRDGDQATFYLKRL